MILERSVTRPAWIIGVGCVLAALEATAAAANSALDPAVPSIFSPASTPADSIFHLSLFVLAIAAGTFLVVFSLLAYAVIKFRRRAGDDGREPPHIYGSNQVELAWTVIPVLIVVVLFLAAARVIHAIEDAKMPPGTMQVVAVGHQFWWEFRYPDHRFVTANELHVPVSDPKQPTPTHITLMSADVDHSFWVPKLAGKTDLIPNFVNNMWIDPHETGVFVGQCVQYFGTQHAKMLLRVVVQSHEDFDKWVSHEQHPAAEADSEAQGRRVFESTACVNCYTISGTNARGTFGPDLTHLMSRVTLASGAANTRENPHLWIKDPNAIKPGCLTPAIQMIAVSLATFTKLATYSPWSPIMDAWSGEPLPGSFLNGRTPLQRQGALIFQDKQCHTCHEIGGSGGKRGPALDSVATALTRDQLVRQVIQGGGNMPAYGKNLNPAEVTALVSFLETLHPSNRPAARDASQAAVQEKPATNP